MNFGLVLILFGVVGYIFGMPLAFYFKYKIQARPTFEAYHPDAGMPEAVREDFDRRFGEFSNLKFQHLGTFSMPHATSNVKTLFAMYEHPVLKVTATTTAMFVKANKVWQLKGQFFSMSTDLADGTEVLTTNHRMLMVFPAQKGSVRTQHPELQQVADLFRAHRLMVEANRNERELDIEMRTKYGGDVPHYLSESSFELLSNAADLGLLRFKQANRSVDEASKSIDGETKPDTNPFHAPMENPFEMPSANVIDQGAVFVSTLRGAFVVMWQSIWPMKNIFSRIRFARDRKMLAKTGFQWP